MPGRTGPLAYVDIAIDSPDHRVNHPAVLAEVGIDGQGPSQASPFNEIGQSCDSTEISAVLEAPAASEAGKTAGLRTVNLFLYLDRVHQPGPLHDSGHVGGRTRHR